MKRMLNILLGVVIGVASTILLSREATEHSILGSLLRKKRPTEYVDPYEPPSVTGKITNLSICRPNYQDPAREGSKITFRLEIIANNLIYEIDSFVVVVAGDNDAVYERTISYRRFTPGYQAVSSPVTIYIDDVSPAQIHYQTLTVRLTDSKGTVFFI